MLAGGAAIVHVWVMHVTAVYCATREGGVVREVMPWQVAYALAMLYPTRLAHLVDHQLVAATKRFGRFADSHASAARIPGIIRGYGIADMQDYVVPPGGFKTLNEFFYRKLVPGARPIDARPGVMCSMADCRITVAQNVGQLKAIWVKGHKFTLDGLLMSRKMGERYRNGGVCVMRLAPQDYHRFHFPCDAAIISCERYAGSALTVVPIAVRTRGYSPLVTNTRVVCELAGEAGRMAVVIVGATMVASVNVTAEEAVDYRKGDELGFFAFGGSSIVMVCEGSVAWDPRLLEASESHGMETIVKMGERIGTYGMTNDQT